MGNNDKKILHDNLETFVKAWECGKTDSLDDILTENCDIDFSIFDKGISVEQFKKDLAVRTRKPTYTRFEVYNYVCALGEERAQQSCVVIGVLVDENEERLCNFSFSGFLIGSSIRTGNSWKYDFLHFELGYTNLDHGRLRTGGVDIDYGNGDPSFVENWNLLNNFVGWQEGSREARIIPEFDSPWYAIKNRIKDESDEEQIEETVYRYCMGLDLDCLDLYDDVFAEDAIAVYSGNRMYDKRGVTEMLRFERQGMIGASHILYKEWIKVHGETADARFYRSGYLPDHLLYGEGKKKNYVNARYDLKFVKENNYWKLYRLDYKEGRLDRELPKNIISCSTEY